MIFVPKWSKLITYSRPSVSLSDFHAREKSIIRDFGFVQLYATVYEAKILQDFIVHDINTYNVDVRMKIKN